MNDRRFFKKNDHLYFSIALNESFGTECDIIHKKLKRYSCMQTIRNIVRLEKFMLFMINDPKRLPKHVHASKN
jgi:hypothetical protein